MSGKFDFLKSVAQAQQDAEKVFGDFINHSGGINQAVTKMAYTVEELRGSDLFAVASTLLGALMQRRDPSLSKPTRLAYVVANNGGQLARFTHSHPFNRENLPRAIDAAYLFRATRKNILYLLPGWRDRPRDPDEIYHTALALEFDIVEVSEEMVVGDEHLPLLPV